MRSDRDPGKASCWGQEDPRESRRWWWQETGEFSGDPLDKDEVEMWRKTGLLKERARELE